MIIERTWCGVATFLGLVGSSAAWVACDDSDSVPPVVDAGTPTPDSTPAEASAGSEAGNDGSAADAEGDGDAGGNAEASTVGACGGAGANLIVNGGFEAPVVPAGGYQTFGTGSAFSGWMVVGANGNVGPLSGAYAASGLTWAAKCGAQTLDLTGLSNTATGVSQAVATVAGTRYTLTFWVGNVVDANGWGTRSTVNVLVDGQSVLVATNSDGAGATTPNWKPFSVSFVAASASTTLELDNGDPSDDSSNLVDDVVLQ